MKQLRFLIILLSLFILTGCSSTRHTDKYNKPNINVETPRNENYNTGNDKVNTGSNESNINIISSGNEGNNKDGDDFENEIDRIHVKETDNEDVNWYSSRRTDATEITVESEYESDISDYIKRYNLISLTDIDEIVLENGTERTVLFINKSVAYSHSDIEKFLVNLVNRLGIPSSEYTLEENEFSISISVDTEVYNRYKNIGEQLKSEIYSKENWEEIGVTDLDISDLSIVDVRFSTDDVIRNSAIDKFELTLLYNIKLYKLVSGYEYTNGISLYELNSSSKYVSVVNFKIAEYQSYKNSWHGIEYIDLDNLWIDKISAIQLKDNGDSYKVSMGRNNKYNKDELNQFYFSLYEQLFKDGSSLEYRYNGDMIFNISKDSIVRIIDETNEEIKKLSETDGILDIRKVKPSLIKVTTEIKDLTLIEQFCCKYASYNQLKNVLTIGSTNQLYAIYDANDILRYIIEFTIGNQEDYESRKLDYNEYFNSEQVKTLSNYYEYTNEIKDSFFRLSPRSIDEILTDHSDFAGRVMGTINSLSTKYYSNCAELTFTNKEYGIINEIINLVSDGIDCTVDVDRNSNIVLRIPFENLPDAQRNLRKYLNSVTSKINSDDIQIIENMVQFSTEYTQEEKGLILAELNRAKAINEILNVREQAFVEYVKTESDYENSQGED